MADEVVTMAEPTPGWSNSAPNAGISAIEGPPIPIDMNQAGFSNNGPAATGATAGTPGSFTPAGADSPDKLGELVGITASPATAWTTGQYVLLGDGTFAHWVGAAWAAGKA